MRLVTVLTVLALMSCFGSGLSVAAYSPSSPPGMRASSIALSVFDAPAPRAGMVLGGQAYAQGAPLVIASAVTVGTSCFTEVDGDGLTDFSSADAKALRDGLAAVSPGGTVKVAGTCAGAVLEAGDTQVALVTKTVTLIGGYIQTNWTDSLPITQPTTLDALGGGRVLSVSMAASVANLIILNGRATSDGGGIYASRALTLTGANVLRNTVQRKITDNCLLDSGRGGGVWFGAAALVVGATFAENAARRNCGISYPDGSGGGAYFDGGAVVTGSAFVSNSAASNGGGAYFRSDASLTGTSLSGNSAYGGGGAYFRGAASLTGASIAANNANGEGDPVFHAVVEVIASSFESNSASYAGGALFNESATIIGTTFRGNVTLGGGAGAYFGGSAVVVDSLFAGNAATIPSDGGGAYFEAAASVTNTSFVSNSASTGGGAYFNYYSFVKLVRARFVGNYAGGFGGGAVFLGGATLTATSFVSNTSAYASGGAVFDGESRITNASFLGNTAQNGDGGGAYFRTGSYKYVVNSLFANNTAGHLGAAIYVEYGWPMIIQTTIASSDTLSNQAVFVASGTAWLNNTLISNHHIGIDGGVPASEDYNLFAGVSVPYSGTVMSGGHSITGAAAFVDPDANDYHLSANSDAINAGANAGIATDFEGQPRPFGAGFDIGYDEWVGLPRGFLPLVWR